MAKLSNLDFEPNWTQAPYSDTLLLHMHDDGMTHLMSCVQPIITIVLHIVIPIKWCISETNYVMTSRHGNLFCLHDPLRRSPVFSSHSISVIHNINFCSYHPELLNKHGCSISMNNRIALITIPFMPNFMCQNFTHDLLSFLCKIWRHKRFIKYYW